MKYPIIFIIILFISFLPIEILFPGANNNGLIPAQSSTQAGDSSDIISFTVELTIEEASELKQYVIEPLTTKHLMSNDFPLVINQENDIEYAEELTPDYVFIHVIGINNSANIIQDGDLNLVNIFLYGIGNAAYLEQEGAGNMMEAEIILDENFAQVVQYGTWNTSSLSQVGFNNNIYIYQNNTN